MPNKKLKTLAQRGVPEIKIPTRQELERMSKSIFKVKTMNWEETDLGFEESSGGEEEEEEVELIGPTFYRPSWGDPEEEPFNAAEAPEPELPPEIAKLSEPEPRTEQLTEEAEDERDDREDTDEEDDIPTWKPIVPTKTISCEGNIETFVGKSIRALAKKTTESTEQKLPPLLPRRDTHPLPGVEQPRFIWQCESETTLRCHNREVEIARFNDNSIFEPVFRIWKNPDGKDPALKNPPPPAENKYTIKLGSVNDEEEDIEDIISLELLERLRSYFSKGSLSMAEYFTAVAKALHLPKSATFPKSLLELFVKIDTFGTGKISWDDLCDFLQQKYAEKAETEYSSPPVGLQLPCKPFETPHRAAICRALTLPDGGLLTFSDDGVVALWTQYFQARIWRALGKPASLRSMTSVEKKNKWFTDIVLLQQLGKFTVTTGEKELQFYDTSTYDPYCQLVNLCSVAIHIDARIRGNGLVIVMGDISGVLCVLVIDDAIDTLRNWSQQRRINNVPTIKLEDAVGIIQGVQYMKYKVHSDMISHVFYVVSMNRVITSAMDKHKSLAMGKLFVTKNANELMEDLGSNYLEGISDIHAPPIVRKIADEVQFPITQGCRTFDVWEEKKWLAAGGLDRLVWVWNLYVPSQPIAKLRGHNAAIFKVVFDVKSETLFSFCTEKNIRIWSLYTNTCIHVFEPKLTKLRGPTLHCFYPTTDAVFIQTSVEASHIKLRRKGDDTQVEGMTHGDAITAVMYNPQHEFFMTCSSEDILVWECRTGKLVAEFNTIGGDGSMHLDTIQSKLEKTMEEESHFVMPGTVERGREAVDTYDVGIVTAVALDNRGRRFFTSHANGVIKAWNFYNGRNLYNLYKPNNNLDICDMHYITINEEHRYLVTVGWDRRVVLYIDTQGPEVVHQTGVPDPPLIFLDKKLNHSDDVWAVAFGYPNVIASGDYSGNILVWNINSGHVVANPIANQCRDQFAEKDSFITALIFHRHVEQQTKNNYLISAGPYHLLHIWRANTNRELGIGSVGWIRPCVTPKDFVTNMKLFKSCQYVVTSDTCGFVSVWTMEDNLEETEPAEWFPKGSHKNGRNKLYNISQSLGLRKKQQGYGKGPVQLRLLRTWKCHVDAFVSLDVCETYGLIITGGRDCSVRIWDMEGRHLGILGQKNTWIVGDPATYARSHPRDVKLDMKRLRGLEVFRGEDKVQPFEIEKRADDRARLLIERKKDQLLSDREIWKKAIRYECLRNVVVPTTTWLQPDSPVGPHRRFKVETKESILDISFRLFEKVKQKKKDYADL